MYPAVLAGITAGPWSWCLVSFGSSRCQTPHISWLLSLGTAHSQQRGKVLVLFRIQSMNEQPGLEEGALPWTGGWNQMSFKVPSSINHSVIVWFSFTLRKRLTRGIASARGCFSQGYCNSLRNKEKIQSCLSSALHICKKMPQLFSVACIEHLWMDRFHLLASFLFPTFK